MITRGATTMTQSASKAKIRIRLFKGLGRTLITAFLLIALVPMALISWLSYDRAHSSLEQEIKIKIENIAELKTIEISSYFKKMLDQLRYQSETEANVNFLTQLITARKTSGKSLSDFVKSFKSARIISNLGRRYSA